MKKQKWVLLILIMALVFSWAPEAVAGPLPSQVSFDPVISCPGFNLDGNSYRMILDPVYLPLNLSKTPTTPGYFSQEEIYPFHFTGSSSGIYEFDPTFLGPNIASIDYDLTVLQTGLLRFTNLNWGLKMVNDTEETLLNSGSADTNFLGSSDYLVISPVASNFTLLDNSDLIYSLSGTTVFVSIPSALLLFGSSLMGLALYGRGKLGPPKLTHKSRNVENGLRESLS
jgi:hypothetical protein